MRSEFDFIQYIKKTHGLKYVGDDCAVLPKDAETDILITADMLVEDIDFRLDWTMPEFLGHKALAVSLSDIAAMGGEPKWAMLSVGVPEKIWRGDFVDRFYEGWFKLARQHDVELIGGDVSKTPDKIVIDSIVTGEIAKGGAVLRSMANAGDAIYVTGQLGGAPAGLKLLESENELSNSNSANDSLIRRQTKPNPQLEIGRYLSSNSIATSMIDISDGLSSDLAHICEASGVGARIDASKIPIDPRISEAGFGDGEALEFALNGGEDFELLFTADEKKFSSNENGEISHIGYVTANAGVIELIRDGKPEILKPKGYRHF